MEAELKKDGRLFIVSLKGRFDTYASAELEKLLDENWNDRPQCLLFNMKELDYISSAGLRVLMVACKKLAESEGVLVLAELNRYCREVLDMTGFSKTFKLFDSLDEALKFCRRLIVEINSTRNWANLEKVRLECGTLRIMRSGDEAGVLKVTGDIRDILHCNISERNLRSRHLDSAGISIGIGGLGEKSEDCLALAGDMMTVGNAVVWLPADGHDTPDFLVPRTSAAGTHVLIRTVYNVMISGGFNESMLFKSSVPGGAPLESIYRELFRISKERRPDFKGVLAFLMTADISSFSGEGLKKPPLIQNAPENGKMIVHPSNQGVWFSADTAPRYRNVSSVLCGVAADLTSDLSDYDEDMLNRVFYLNPANAAGKTALVHTNAAVFRKMSGTETPVDIEMESAEAVRQGEFLDMRRIRSDSRISEAFIGVSYIQHFRENDDVIDETPDELREEPHVVSRRTLLNSYRKFSGN